MLRFAILPERFLVIVLVIFIAYVAVLAFAYLRQEKMLYFPHKCTRAEENERAGQLGLFLWPASSGDYYGAASKDFTGQSRGVFLIFHGNAGSAVDRFYYIAEIQRFGYRVVLFEYPGYGARPGPLREDAFVADAIKAARAAAETFGEPLYVLGESLGCGIASALAGAKEVAVKGVVMITPWDTLPDLAQSIYWLFPARWLVRDKYDNIKNLQDFKGPIAVVMAGKDEIIPNKRTKRLFESLPGNKRMWTLQGAGHNDWPEAVDWAWWKEVINFANGGTHEY